MGHITYILYDIRINAISLISYQDERTKTGLGPEKMRNLVLDGPVWTRTKMTILEKTISRPTKLEILGPIGTET